MATSSRRRFLASSAVGLAAVAAVPARAAEPAPRRFSLIGFTKPFAGLSFSETADVVAEVG